MALCRADAVQVMTENPYRLARDIRGIGFKTADAIAVKLGIEKTAMIRVRAGISYALTAAMDEGHCGLPTDELVPLAEKLLEVSADLVRAALDLEWTEGTVIADSVGETPAGLWFRRRAHASHLSVVSAVDLANGQGRGLGLAHCLESGPIVSQKALCVCRKIIETTELGHHEPSDKIRLGLRVSFLGDTDVGARGHGGPIGSPAQTRQRSWPSLDFSWCGMVALFRRPIHDHR